MGAWPNGGNTLSVMAMSARYEAKPNEPPKAADGASPADELARVSGLALWSHAAQSMP